VSHQQCTNDLFIAKIKNEQQPQCYHSPDKLLCLLNAEDDASQTSDQILRPRQGSLNHARLSRDRQQQCTSSNVTRIYPTTNILQLDLLPNRLPWNSHKWLYFPVFWISDETLGEKIVCQSPKINKTRNTVVKIAVHVLGNARKLPNNPSLHLTTRHMLYPTRNNQECLGIVCCHC